MIKRVYMLLPLLLIIAGCATTQEIESPQQNALEVAQIIIQSIQDDDSNKFLQYMSPISGERVGKKDFIKSQEEMKQNFGTLEEIQFIRELKTPMVSNFIWLFTFKRINSDKETVIQDMLFRVVVAPLDDKFRVISMGFI